MKRTRKSEVAVLLAMIVVTAACLHKSGGAAVTPMEKATAYNASLAGANNTLEKGLEAAVSAGAMSPAQAAPLIGATGRVATIHLQITTIMQQAAITQADLASITALLDQLKASVNAIPPPALGIKNPNSQQTFEEDVQAIYGIADAVLNSLQGVVK